MNYFRCQEVDRTSLRRRHRAGRHEVLAIPGDQRQHQAKDPSTVQGRGEDILPGGGELNGPG